MKLASIATAALLAVYAAPAWAEGDESTEDAVPASSSAAATSQPAEPSAFQRWWNGEESIYSGGFNLSFGFMSGGYNGGKLQTDGLAESSTGISEGSVSGFRGDLGTSWRHFGLLILGAAYYTTGDTAQLEFGKSKAPVTLRGADIRLFQPRFRYAKWRFEAAASAGPVAHLGWAQLDENRLGALGSDLPGSFQSALDNTFYGIAALEVGASLRFYPLGFLFVEGAYNHSFGLFSLAGDMDGMNQLRLMAGLAF